MLTQRKREKKSKKQNFLEIFFGKTSQWLSAVLSQ